MIVSPGQLVVRPVREDDLEPLLVLLKSIPHSITSLQPKREYMESRIHQSLRSFYPVVKEPGAEKYFFVLEDQVNQRLAGTCGIYAKTGGFEPVYTYEIVEETHQHGPLDIETKTPALHLRIEHEGPSEFGSLYLHPDYRGGGRGGTLSRSRFHFVKAFPERFTREVMAEFRGVVKDSGEVPFWEAIGRHFFQRDFFSLDQYSAVARKDFIRDLMPRHPIYITLLPEEAQSVIGKPHPHAVPAVHVLENEGFRYINHVDIFDAGPIYQAALSKTKTIENSRTVQLEKVVDSVPDEKSQSGLISRIDLDFRATSGSCLVKDNLITLPVEIADALKVEPGMKLQFLPDSRS